MGTDPIEASGGHRVIQRNVRCGDWSRLSARRRRDDVALYSEGRTFTFAAFNSRVNHVATMLRRVGVRRGHRVAIFGNDSHRYLEVIFACMKLGAVYAPLNPRLSAGELQAVLRVCEPAVLFADGRYSPLVEGLDVSTLREIVSFDVSGTVGEQYETWINAGTDEEIDTVVDDGDLACLAFTSGTTGLPKAVMHTQAMTKFGTMQSIMERRLPEQAVHYSASSLFHISGRLYAIAGIARGSASVLLPGFDPDAVLDLMATGRVNGCFLVPTMISAILQHPRTAHGDYSQLMSIVYGAAPMSVPLLRQAIDVFGCDFIQMFGAGTEAGLQTVLTPRHHRRAMEGEEHLLGSIGKPAFGVDLRLCDDDLNDVPVGEVGEIVTRADAVMSGYLDMPEESSRVLVDGWFRGGDLAFSDAEGFVYLRGRRDDMIIRGGENVYPSEVETVLLSHPAVMDAAVVGIPDEHWGQTLRAHVILHAGSILDPDALRAHCRDRLAAYKVPEDFRVHSAFPKNASGKVLKGQLAAQG